MSLFSRNWGTKLYKLEEHCKQIHYKGNKYGKRAGTWEHRAILDGNKGTRDPPGRPSVIDYVFEDRFKFDKLILLRPGLFSSSGFAS